MPGDNHLDGSHEPVVNPCRHNIFDVFLIDKSEMDIGIIREKIRAARDRLDSGNLRARDGRELTLSEAEVNPMEAILLDPLGRLQAEQFVHQAHLFSQDEELVRVMAQLDRQKNDPVEQLLGPLEKALLRSLTRALPPLKQRRLEDDLPWPDEPGSCAVQREPPEAAILRDR